MPHSQRSWAAGDGAPRPARLDDDAAAATLHPARRGAAFALALATIAAAARAAPAWRASAVCDATRPARDARTQALLCEYCRLSIVDSVALLTALCAGVTTLVTCILALVVSRRKYDALLKSVLASLSAVFLLESLTYAMEAPALGLSVVARGDSRPWVYADAAKYARWLFVHLWLEDITAHVTRLADEAGRRAQAQATGGGTGPGAAAASPPPYPAPPSPLCPPDGARRRWWRALVPSADAAGLLVAIAANVAGHTSGGGLRQLALEAFAAGSWAWFHLAVITNAGAVRVVADSGGGSAGMQPPGRPDGAVPGSGDAAGGGTTQAGAPPAASAPAPPLPRLPPVHSDDDAALRVLLRRLEAVAHVATAVIVACQWARAAAPASTAGVRVAAAAEAGYLLAEYVVIMLLPLARLQVLVLLFNDARDLEERVTQRVAAFADKAATAARAAEARRRMMRAVWHELRTPANAVALGLEALHDWRGMPSGDVDELVTMLAASSSTSKSILNTMLSLAALESGSFAISPAPCSLRVVASQVQWQLQPWARSIGAALELTVDEAVPPLVIADGPRLCQVISNYVSNALKHCPQDGSGRVTITVRRLDGGGGGSGSGGEGSSENELDGPAPDVATTARSPRRRPPSLSPSHKLQPAAPPHAAGGTGAATVRVRVSVTDNGPGIPHEAQHILFRPFVMQHGGPAAAAESPARRAGRGPAAAGDVATAAAPPPLPATASMPRTLSGTSPTRRPLSAESASDSGPRSGRSPASGGSSGTSAARRLGREFHPEGTGLGLSIARELICAHGGSVGVDSEPGHGATFWAELTLPVAKRQPDIRAARAAAASPAAQSAHGGGGGGGGGLSNGARPTLLVRTPPTLRTPPSAAASPLSAQGSPLLVARSMLAALSSDGSASGSGGAPVSPRAHADAPVAAAHGGLPPERLRFLVVDDAVTNRKVLMRLMRSRWPAAAMTVDEGADGVDAVDAVERRLREDPSRPLWRAYDAAVIDGRMPRLSGYDAVRRIRELEAGASNAGGRGGGGLPKASPLLPSRSCHRLLIVGVTGDALEEDQAAFRGAGADAVLIKPVAASELFGLMERHWRDCDDVTRAAAQQYEAL
jgi:signal transduction histidine kinase/CheY-like chemotaxis protein